MPRDPVTGGTVLRLPAIQSPDYVPGVSGWAVNADGSAEFQDITLPGGLGVSVFFAASAPVTSHVGDLWYDTSSGLALNRWDGTSWVAYQIGTGAIAAGAVTNSLLAAAAVAASNIQDGAITATQISAAAGIVGTMLAGGTITATQLADAAVTPAKISALSPALLQLTGPLNYNPYLLNGSLDGWAGNYGTLVYTSSPPAGSGMSGAAQYTYSGSGNGHVAATSRFGVTPGVPFQVSSMCYPGTTIFQTGVSWFDASGAYISSTTKSPAATASAWQIVTVAFPGTDIPANAATAALYLFDSGDSGYLAWCVVMPAVAGESLTAGSVTAAQIASGTITASQIAAGTITAAEIASGTITAALLAAGIVVAGIVDATTITGATVVADGTAGEFLAYSGTPAAGNLIASTAGSGSSDSSGNSLLDKIAAYSNSSGTYYAVQLVGSNVSFWSAPAYNGTYTLLGSIGVGSSGELVINWPNSSVYIPSPLATIYAEDPAAPGNLESWHPITLDSGWSTASGYEAPGYRLLPDGDVEFRGLAVNSSSLTTTTALNSGAPLPAAYRPAKQKIYRGADPATNRGGIQLNTAGVLSMTASASYPASHAELDGTASL